MSARIVEPGWFTRRVASKVKHALVDAGHPVKRAHWTTQPPVSVYMASRNVFATGSPGLTICVGASMLGADGQPRWHCVEVLVGRAWLEQSHDDYDTEAEACSVAAMLLALLAVNIAKKVRA